MRHRITVMVIIVILSLLTACKVENPYKISKMIITYENGKKKRMFFDVYENVHYTVIDGCLYLKMYYTGQKEYKSVIMRCGVKSIIIKE